MYAKRQFAWRVHSNSIAGLSSFANIRRIYRQNYTSVYSFDYKFRASAKHRFWLIRAASLPLLKILNVSERTGMSVVSSRIEFALRTRSQRMYTDVHSLACPRLIFAHASYLYRLFAKALAIQNHHGGRWFQAESSSQCELAAKEYTRMYIF